MKNTIITSLIVVAINYAMEVNAVDIPASVNPANIMNGVNKALPGNDTTPAKNNINEQGSGQKAVSSKNETAEILLKEIKLSGAKQIIPAKVTAVYKPLLGKKITFNDIQKMAVDMQQAYRNEGLILVRVILPPQEIDQSNGIVQINIIEGQIEKVVFQDNLSNVIKPQMQRYASKIEAEDPVTYASIDRFLILTNDLPGVQASATLSPNANVVGGSDLLMDVKQTKVSGFVNYNNRGTKYVGPDQLTIGGSIYDIFSADSLSIAGATTPDHSNQMSYGNIRYDIVVGPYGTGINASFTTTHSKPGDSLSAFEMKGRSNQYVLGVNQPIIVTTRQRVNFLSALTHVNSYNNVFTDQQLYRDTITTLTTGLGYQGVFWQTYNDVKFFVTKGLPIFGAPSTLSNPSVAGASTKFWRFNLETSHSHYFSQKTSVAFGTQFQLSQNKLVSSEQISYGGAVFGQGFKPNVISGDSGALGSIALRYDLPSQRWVSLIQPHIFYDVGTARMNSVTSGVSNSATGESAGIGLNLILFNHWKVGFALAKPLNITNTVGVDMEWHGYFNVTGVF